MYRQQGMPSDLWVRHIKKRNNNASSDSSGFKLLSSAKDFQKLEYGSVMDWQKQEYERAIAYLKASEDGKSLIERLEGSEEGLQSYLLEKWTAIMIQIQEQYIGILKRDFL
ncbi:hypothetical protein RBH29_03655 [Herbivorax sp. ANBcel31]|uniref:hypothetical protein n=1 Tax=Herbivorax sp. ANBcel31 TaxID=3069754 RepID=UPI0027B27753|nr:hypothetical protein [Herbivorax sp. ANBcel31]MDQ2085528.1 hypothetical protein [Herbivorax sp. ANBcel31]